jgi:hypothetical protein
MVNSCAVCGCCTRTDIVREHLEDTLRICDVSAKGLLLKLNFYKINRSPTLNPSLTLTPNPNLLRVRKVGKKSLKNFNKKHC